MLAYVLTQIAGRKLANDFSAYRDTLGLVHPFLRQAFPKAGNPLFLTDPDPQATEPERKRTWHATQFGRI